MYFNVKFCAWILARFGLYVQFRIINETALERDQKNFSKIVEFVTKKFKVKKLVLTHNPPHECQKLNDKHQVENFTHHSSHALSAFYMSPFEDAVCLVMDAVGSDFTYPNEDWFRINKVKDIEGIRGHETTSIFEISKNYKLNRLYQIS